MLSIVIRNVRKPKVANSPTLPVGQLPRLWPMIFCKFALLTLLVKIKRRSIIVKIFIFIFSFAPLVKSGTSKQFTSF